MTSGVNCYASQSSLKCSLHEVRQRGLFWFSGFCLNQFVGLRGSSVRGAFAFGCKKKERKKEMDLILRKDEGRKHILHMIQGFSVFKHKN